MAFDAQLPASSSESTLSLHKLSPEPNVQSENSRHFRTDHLQRNLKGRAVSSGFITATSQAVIFGLTMGSTVILARLLTPHDFGLVAMVVTVTGFLKNFKNAGLSAATIQSAEITHGQVSNLFWINVGLGVVACGIVAALAPVVAWFYHEPKLILITFVLALTFVFEGLSVQNTALLNRQMRFKAIAAIQIGSMLTGMVIGIGMALSDCGYWSLVGMQLAMPVLSFALSWLMCRWRPSLPKRNSGTRPLLTFGANLTASSFIYSLIGGMDGLLIGKLYGAEVVGLYTRAGALLRRPMEQLLSPVNRVFIPVLSRMQDQPERFRRAFLQLFHALALLSFLFSGLCLPLALPITMVVLGPKWEAAANIFASLTVAALFTPLAATCSWLFESQGRGKDALLMSVLSSGVTLVAYLAGLPFGAFGVALSWAISTILFQLPLFFYVAGRNGPIRAIELWTGFFVHLPVWFAVAGSTFLVRNLIAGWSYLNQLLLCFPIGLLAGASVIIAFGPVRRTAKSMIDAIATVRIKRSKA